MSNTRLNLTEAVQQTGAKRQKRADLMEEFIKEGWTFVQKGFKLVKEEKNARFSSFPCSKVRP